MTRKKRYSAEFKREARRERTRTESGAAQTVVALRPS